MENLMKTEVMTSRETAELIETTGVECRVSITRDDGYLVSAKLEIFPHPINKPKEKNLELIETDTIETRTFADWRKGVEWLYNQSKRGYIRPSTIIAEYNKNL